MQRSAYKTAKGSTYGTTLNNQSKHRPLFSAPILASEWWIYNARPEKQRRAVLIVLPFVGMKGSGSKYAAITLKFTLKFVNSYNHRLIINLIILLGSEALRVCGADNLNS